jgi:surface protein
MFSNCESLTSINLSNFNTQNVNDMIWMFLNCKSLKKENIITKDKKILDEF